MRDGPRSEIDKIDQTHSPTAAHTPMAETPPVSIVTPTLREAPNLGRLAERIDRTLPRGSWELLVVDDDSDDGTDRVARGLADRLPVRLQTRRHGAPDPAAAVLDGIIRSNHHRIVVMAADLGHEPEDIPKLLDGLDRGFDMAVGSRYALGGAVSPITPLPVRIGDWLKTEMAMPLTPDCDDPLSGFFALDRRKLAEPSEMDPRGGAIALELIVRGQLKCTNIPITTGERHRGDPKRRWPPALGYATQLARLYCLVGTRPIARRT